MRLLALDPGLTTGAVCIEWDGHTPCPPPDCLVLAAQIEYPVMPWWLTAQLDGDDPMSLLVIERFIINARTMKFTRQPEALHVIGGAMFLAALRGVPVREQSASDAKKIYPNARLKELRWRVTGDHARDALRHVLLATHKPLDL